MVVQWIVSSAFHRDEAVMNFVWRVIDDVTRHAGELDRQQWVVLSVLVLGLGLLTMRGFGSRNNY